MTELIGLAELCEKATGPDRELDILIWAVTNSLPVIWDGNNLYATTNMLLGWIDPGKHSRNFTPLGSVESRPLYTASLDAAMTLVPEGWDIRMGTNGSAPWAQCKRARPVAECHNGDAATLSLSICAAALRARATKETHDGTE